METVLIQTKLNRPYLRSDLVERPILMQRLNQNPDRNFTLVSAPAGFGKTTLIASWLAQRDSHIAWLSLDKFDNDLFVFLQHVTAAVRQVFPDACAGLLQALQAPDSPATSELAAMVINELSRLPEPMLLVLDDYHMIHNGRILQLVARVLEQTQDRLHLVIISRTDPLLPLPRLRLQQGLVEIRQQDLRFSDEEAESFMHAAVADDIDHDTITHLNQQVEGWVAGLRLASLSIEQPDQLRPLLLDSQENAHDFIAGYFFTEVFARQPIAVQEFLLQTAFVDRFCARLGHELVRFSAPDDSVAGIIAYLQQANLFTIPLDEETGWFRYHHLFRQMLQQRAGSHLDKAAVLALHNRAGQWFTEEGLVDEALYHFLIADDTNSAVSLIEASSHNLLNSLERRRLERWMELLPEGLVWQSPRLLVAKAWLLYRHWQLQALAAVIYQLDLIVTQNMTGMTTADRQFILGQMYTLKSAGLYMIDENASESFTTAERALSYLPATEQGAMGTALGYLGLSLQAQGEYETAVSRMEQALADPTPFSPARVQLYLGLSFIHLAAGNLLALKQTVDQFRALSPENPLGNSAACWVSGIYHYELNHLDKAQDFFETTVSLHYSTNFLAACDSWLALARISQDRGELVQAQDHLDAVQAETLRLGSRDLLPVGEAVQAYQWQLQGETAAALRWARAFDPHNPPDWALLTTMPLLLWARILAAHGNEPELHTVLQTLQSSLSKAQSRHFTQRMIQLLAHIALIQVKLGDDGQAQNALASAVRLAEQGGFLRSFTDCGLALRPLLEQLRSQPIAPEYIAQLIAAFPAPGQTQHARNGRPINAEMATLLTSRETELLYLIQTGLSNKEIAQTLVISLPTVKRHASNIYRKLKVNGRRQAIYKAQQAGILSTD